MDYKLGQELMLEVTSDAFARHCNVKTGYKEKFKIIKADEDSSY